MTRSRTSLLAEAKLRNLAEDEFCGGCGSRNRRREWASTGRCVDCDRQWRDSPRLLSQDILAVMSDSIRKFVDEAILSQMANRIDALGQESTPV